MSVYVFDLYLITT